MITETLLNSLKSLFSSLGAKTSDSNYAVGLFDKTNGEPKGMMGMSDLASVLGVKCFSLPNINSQAVHIATISNLAGYQQRGFYFGLQGFGCIASGYFAINRATSDTNNAHIEIAYTACRPQSGFSFIVTKSNEMTYKVYATGSYTSTSGGSSIIVIPGEGTSFGDDSEVTVSSLTAYETKSLENTMTV